MTIEEIKVASGVGENSDDYTAGFEDGAKWAKKKTIDEICDYLLCNINICPSPDKFINNLKEVMGYETR